MFSQQYLTSIGYSLRSLCLFRWEDLVRVRLHLVSGLVHTMIIPRYHPSTHDTCRFLSFLFFFSFHLLSSPFFYFSLLLILVLRGTIVNRTNQCQQKWGNIQVFVCTVGPIYYGPPKIVVTQIRGRIAGSPPFPLLFVPWKAFLSRVRSFHPFLPSSTRV